MIELIGAGKRYGRAWALRPTDLVVRPGETTALIGPSGCGKSTLLRLVVGLIEPDAGQVMFDGKPVRDNLIENRRRMGYVIQDGGLFPHLTAEGNVLLLARHLGRAESDLKSRLTRLAELTRFPADGLTRYPVELSGGQRQRVSLMRALALEPEALLLDEPLGALDPLVRHAMQADLKQLFAALEQTVLMVTHDLAEAAYLADRIVLMMDGAVVQVGTMDDLRTKPATPEVTQFVEAQRGKVAL